MPENFLQLSAKDRVGVIRTAASKSGRSGPLMDKDVWVVWALSTFFESSLGSHLVFKGGTALSTLPSVTVAWHCQQRLTLNK
jgi:predicted nucleotidyltransferase component of viral defense system